MLEPKDVLLAKLERVTDDKEIAFVVTLLTCGGHARLSYGRPEGFAGYIFKYGESTFGAVKETLAGTGLIADTDEGLTINYPGFASLPSERREEIVGELSEAMWRHARRFFEAVLGPVVATPEGRYVLGESAKAWPSLNEANVDHVRQVAGWDNWQAISEPLAEAGILLHIGSGKQHDYYGLFPPVAMRFSGSLDQAALAYVYVAQGVRHEAAGVLRQDCGQFLPAIEDLVLTGMVRRASWYGLSGFQSTDLGDSQVRTVMERRLQQAHGPITDRLDSLPMGLAHFLVEEVCLPDQGGGRQVHAGEWGFRGPLDGSSHECLLDFAAVREPRDELFKVFVDSELAVVTHWYVSTRRGELREELYVLAPELRGLLRKWIAAKGWPPFALPEDLEAKHRAYYSLRGSLEYGGAASLTPLLSQPTSEIKAQVEAAIEDFSQDRLLAREGDLIRVTHHGDFLRVMETRFRQPIVDFLLSGGPTGRLGVHRGGPVPQPLPGQDLKETRPTDQEPQSVALRVPLGKTERGESYYWEPLGESDPHFLIVGSPGMGKTQTAKAVITNLRRQDVPAFVIDFENEYGDQAIVGRILKPGDDVTVNPLDLLEGPPTMVKFRVSGILKKIYKLGDRQESLLRSAIAGAYEGAGILEKDKSTWNSPPPAFESIREQLGEVAQGKGEKAKRAEAVLNRLEPIFELALFGGKTQVAFEDVLRNGATVFLRDLPTDETKLAAAEFFLRWLWHRILREGETKSLLRLLVVLDEAHKLAYEQSPVAALLRQGRKYGVGVLLSTQQPDDFESKELAFQNTAFHICFSCNAERHARTMAREMLGGEDLYQTIRKLKRFEAVALSHREASGPRALTIVPYYELVARST